MTERIDPKLLAVPETMLWTLHNRADEAARHDSILDDPQCLAIYQALDYDYEQSFGRADGSHGVRSWLFDKKIREFLQQHPDGVIVNLGEGLETQRFRVPTQDTLWLSVDLPEALAIRERFIQPDEHHRHLGLSALDNAWFDAVPADKPVFITAQGLFMYFDRQQVRELVQAIGERFPGAWLMFDYLPQWLSNKTLSAKGWMKTPHYRTPPMPWGIARADISPTFSRWLCQSVVAENVVFLYPRGVRRYAVMLFEKIPWICNRMPGVTFMRLPASVKS